MKAKKSLGQHFLKSEKALHQIRDAADVTGADIVLEIGPGLGVLTADLLQFAGKVVAIEKDRDLIPHIKEKFTMAIAENKLEILEEDVLDFDPNIMNFYKDFTYKVVANIPYYITGAILEKFLSSETQPESMTLLIQKEVAERIVARDKKESILSLSVKAYGTPKIIAKVPAGAFNPPPNVDSAILHIDRISRDFFSDIDEQLFFDLIKTTFAGKRKQIGGTLALFLKNRELALDLLQKTTIDPKSRPEDISLSSWKKLTHALTPFKQS
jgi:16S rRNA (adenine1518-N6/adenine1519-N6)-dimethyltransferase